MPQADRIGIVEASYDTASNDLAWMARLLEQTAPLIDQGMGCAGYLTAPDGEVRLHSVTLRGMSDDVWSAFVATGREVPAGALACHRSPLALGTVGQRLGTAQREIDSIFLTHFRPYAIREILGLGAADPTGVGCFFVAPQTETRRPRQQTQRRWTRVSVHLCAALRLRAAIRSEGEPVAVVEGEAILESDGKTAHATGAARPQAAREALRVAARAIDRARGRLRRRSEDEALELWQGLVAGRWSLIDRHDADGRRYFIARRNDPGVLDPRGLSRRERQVLAYVGMGHSLKLIAYELGLSSSTIAQHRSNAMRKLGLTRLTDVAHLFSRRPKP